MKLKRGLIVGVNMEPLRLIVSARGDAVRRDCDSGAVGAVV